MEKFFLKNSSQEVKLGDILISTNRENTPTIIRVSEDNIPILLEEGVITKEAIDKDKGVPMQLEYYIGKIAKRLGWKIERTYNYLNNIDTILPAAAFSMILREIATELDKKYSDHIENSPEIYVVSLFDGRITKANKAHIKNYRNFAAFRSIEDAKIACRITRDIIEYLFPNGK